MKTRLLALLLGIWLCLPGSSLAAVKEFEQFSADMPEGWTDNVVRGMVLLMAPNARCLITIAFQPSNGMDAQAFAENMTRALNAPLPKRLDGSDIYAFTAPVAGANTRTLVREHGGRVLIFSIAGDENKHRDAVKAIWESLDSKDPQIRALFGK